jgi:hypothetical protein
VRVFGTLKGETEPRVIEGTVEGWMTQNKQWQTMADQMLAYRGAREWARRHMPETLLGIHADEELPEVVQTEKVTVVSPTSLTDFGEVVSAKNDPKPVVVDAEPLPEHGGEAFVKPAKAETKKAEKAPILDPQEAAIDKLFQ